MTTDAERARTAPLKVSVKRETRGGGASSAAIIPPEELARQRVERGWLELAEWRKQYGDLPDFSAIGAMVDGLLVARTKQRAVA